MSHSTCTHRDRVDSRLLVVGSQIASLTSGPSFDHNLCCRCPNGSCDAIFDIYTSRTFQQYKEHLKARCFDPCNRPLSFLESRRTLKSHFRECEWRPHTSLKVGLRHWDSNSQHGSSFESVRVHSLALFGLFGSMQCASRGSLLARNLASLCLGHNPKARVAT